MPLHHVVKLIIFYMYTRNKFPFITKRSDYLAVSNPHERLSLWADYLVFPLLEEVQLVDVRKPPNDLFRSITPSSKNQTHGMTHQPKQKFINMREPTEFDRVINDRYCARNPVWLIITPLSDWNSLLNITVCIERAQVATIGNITGLPQDVYLVINELSFYPHPF